MHIVDRDELGSINGLLHYSRYVLGVDPFWFWAELPPALVPAAQAELIRCWCRLICISAADGELQGSEVELVHL